jgi:hypothetical protein
MAWGVDGSEGECYSGLVARGPPVAEYQTALGLGGYYNPKLNTKRV